MEALGVRAHHARTLAAAQDRGDFGVLYWVATSVALSIGGGVRWGKLPTREVEADQLADLTRLHAAERSRPSLDLLGVDTRALRTALRRRAELLRLLRADDPMPTSTPDALREEILAVLMTGLAHQRHMRRRGTSYYVGSDGRPRLLVPESVLHQILPPVILAEPFGRLRGRRLRHAIAARHVLPGGVMPALGETVARGAADVAGHFDAPVEAVEALLVKALRFAHAAGRTIHELDNSISIGFERQHYDFWWAGQTLTGRWGIGCERWASVGRAADEPRPGLVVLTMPSMGEAIQLEFGPGLLDPVRPQWQGVPRLMKEWNLERA